MASFGGTSLGSSPFAGISDEIVLWGGKHCAIKRVVVGGKIYDCGIGPNTGQDILSSIAGWANSLLKGYQSISVGSFSAAYARCDSLEITNSDYLGAEYRAEFLAYPEEWFTGPAGVLEPTDNINASYTQDGLMIVKRTASARAATDRGFDAVLAWIASLNLQSPPNVGKLGFESVVVNAKSLVQTIDRVNGSITAEATFVQNTGGSDDTVLNYSANAQYDDKAGIYTVTIDGSLEGNTKTTMAQVRSKVQSIGFFQLANDIFGKIGADATLDPSPSSISISENDETDSVNFSVSFNTFPSGGEKKYFNFTIDCDHIKNIVTVTISGTVSFDSRISMKERADKIESIIQQYDFAGLCNEEFDKNSPNQNILLNVNNPVSYSVTFNKGSDVTADVSVSYSTENIIPNDSYITFDYDIEINPSSNIMIPIQFLNGGGGAFDFKSNKRGSASIRGTALTKEAGFGQLIIDEALSLLDEALSSFSPQDEILLEKNVIQAETSDNGFLYEFEIKKGAILGF